MQLTHGLTIPRRFTAIVNHANVHERQRASGANADFVSFILGPVAHVRLERRAYGDRGCLRHTPDLDEANALFVEFAHQRLRHGGAADKPSHAWSELPAA